MTNSPPQQRLSSIHVPSTPKTPTTPFSPPKRFSSLAFASASRTIAHNSPYREVLPVGTRNITATPCSSQTTVEKRQLFASPPARDTPPQLQGIIHAAKGALHRDMFAASSPASSIESRMNMDHLESWQPQGNIGADTKEWRYSTAPLNLATAFIDVREPLPMPFTTDAIEGAISAPVNHITESVGRGPVSPDPEDHVSCRTHLSTVTSSHHPAVSLVSGQRFCEQEELSYPDEVENAGVDKDMQRLRFDSEDSGHLGTANTPLAKSPVNSSCHEADVIVAPGSPVDRIYLSESAEAAAESAKAKRRWLKGIFVEGRGDELSTDQQEYEIDVRLPPMPMACPDPVVHMMPRVTVCPEPALHTQSPVRMVPVNYYESDVTFPAHEVEQIIPAGSARGLHRATATGSPMPFPKLRSRPPTTHSDYQTSMRSPTPFRDQLHDINLDEHFQPGWYYAREPLRQSPRPIYSFSTAASKAIGMDPAPDSRMRDSYKTDTLTALPISTTRYRKNGIGADVISRGVSRYYQRPPSSARTIDSRPRTSSRQTYASSTEVRFRSSPPRASDMEQASGVRRKRALDDSFVEAEETYRPANITPDLHNRGRHDAIRPNRHNPAAIRTSVFGTSTPEALRSAREGIRELSPNVQLYRKATQERENFRKKRRPSYWDNDLKEVRESPASRGGVRSPVSAQESMRAEFEMASQKDVEMNLDDEPSAGSASESTKTE